ncbi:phosphotransferase family protein [[Mycobacterium] vasticus]|uniref:Phosphotransferase family protein n=1 Tax=[Mycobacterium] vasticus TaxID=2875777 RepID=A0ABU5Z6X5_9MYCO|nr:phosphotransferase family protein [Mycolicibacter sp. MYC017]MEB3071698.1 phosphotransferase family protein [Mycolicibacter sp. MYC017]
MTDVKRSWPGMSRETWFVTSTGTRGGRPIEQRHVFRMDPPGGGFGLTSLGFEADVYKMLSGTNIPMQPMLWHEPAGNDWLKGREFFVRGWVDGEVTPTHLDDPDPQFDCLRAQVVKEHVERLADIHSLDWKALGFDSFANYVPDGVEDAAAVELDWHLEHILSNGVEPYPAVVEALLTLREQLPPPSARVVIRKENNGIGEEIWQGSKIVAMSDWESASLGAPELDLAIAAGTTFHFWDVQKALAYYQEITGLPINPEALEFYGRVWSMRAVVGLQGGLRPFHEGVDQRLQVASLGLWATGTQSLLARATGF